MMSRLLTAASLGILLLATGCKDKDKKEPETGDDQVVANANFETKTVYGKDNRKDLYQVTDPQLINAARATLALVRNGNFRRLGNGDYQLNTLPYGPTEMLCDTEPFFNQQKASYCSGFLISPNRVVTAAHCFDGGGKDCSTFKLVTDYVMFDANNQKTVFKPSEVYSCAKILVHHFDPKGVEYAVIELDRPITDRPFFKMRQGPVAKSGQEFVLIGYPKGLPVKVAADAYLRGYEMDGYFVTNTDSFSGSSGSPVLNRVTNEVEGILVAGEPADYQHGPGNKACWIAKKCDMEGCLGEGVTDIKFVTSFQ